MKTRSSCSPALVRRRARSSFALASLLLAALTRTAGAICSQQATFNPPAFFAAGNNARDVALGDFNSDGIVDVAVANSDFLISDGAASSISILLGNGAAGVGNGTFALPVNYLAGNRPVAIAAADFNHDGIFDLAVADWGSDDVAILLGHGAASHGDGTFGAATLFAAGSHPYGITTGDFDEDGNLDVAVSNNGSNTVAVMRGSGSGSLSAPTFHSIVGISTSIVTGDFDQDGILDLAATCYSPTGLGVLLGTGSGGVGDGGFLPAVNYAAGGQPFDVASGDWNEDGVVDLAVSNGSGGGVAILRGLGNGTFASATFFGAGISGASITPGDYDQDGITDLAVSYGASSKLSLLFGQGAGGVGNGAFGLAVESGVPGFPAGSARGDFNADGRPDLVIADFFGTSVAVLLGGCSDPAPHLVSVRDVPHDDGGSVFLRWLPSALDVAPQRIVTSYRVWRRLPPGLRASSPEARSASVEPSRHGRAESAPLVIESRGDGIQASAFWEAIATVPAQYLEGYGFTAPTTQDSMVNSNPLTAFFVTALTTDPFVFYSSNVDSGYSVDNTPPPAPNGFVGAYASAGVALHWEPGAVADFQTYRLYRGPDPSFTPSPANLIASPADTGFVDPEGSLASYYVLTIVDTHNNESDASRVAPPGAVGVEPAGLRLDLRVLTTPGSGRLSVAFTLPSSRRSSIELFDPSGRRLSALELDALGAGTHRRDLGVSSLSSGLYFVRLTQDGTSVVAKASVMR